jgi:hypothetical protein
VSPVELTEGKRVGGGGGSQIIYDGEDAWLFINHSTLNISGYNIGRIVLEQVVSLGGWLVTVNYNYSVFSVHSNTYNYTPTPKPSLSSGLNSQGPIIVIYYDNLVVFLLQYRTNSLHLAL